MWVGVPVLDIGERGHHHLHKSHPSRDLCSGLWLRFRGSQGLKPRGIGGIETLSRGWVVLPLEHGGKVARNG